VTPTPPSAQELAEAGTNGGHHTMMLLCASALVAAIDRLTAAVQSASESTCDGFAPPESVHPCTRRRGHGGDCS